MELKTNWREIERAVSENADQALLRAIGIARAKQSTVHIPNEVFFNSVIADAAEYLQIQEFRINVKNKKHLKALIKVATCTIKHYNQSMIVDPSKSTSSYRLT